MPTSCAHFALLQTRFTALSQKFVSDQVADEQMNPLTFQPDLDRLAAYRLLIHAELEVFLEAKAKEHLMQITAMIAGGQPWMRKCPELLALSIAVDRSGPQASLADYQSFLVYIGEIVNFSIKLIAGNNGIKTKSFQFLSLCAGKTIDEVDNFLSASLNSYGKGRGDLAYKSVTHSSALQAPSAELTTADTLIKALGVYFDVCP